jgi:hypothetical protein
MRASRDVPNAVFANGILGLSLSRQQANHRKFSFHPCLSLRQSVP